MKNITQKTVKRGMKFKIFCAQCDTGLRACSKHQCVKCKKWFCDKHIYTRVDESNIAITKNAPKLCKEDYKDHYNNQH